MTSEALNARIRVIAAVIRADDRYLVCRRPMHKRHGGLWEFPGGKMRAGEGYLEAADRELGEELRVRALRAGPCRYTAADPGSPFMVEFVEVSISGTPRPVEHLQIRWVKPSEMTRLVFAPADTDFIGRCLGKSP